MTEDEAKTKWCPYSRVAGGHVADRGNRWPVDRHGDVASVAPMLPASRCIASACMAWREIVAVSTGNNVTVTIFDGDIIGGQDNMPRAGYCGLAGRP